MKRFALACACAVVILAHPLSGQSATTCGWSQLTPHESPRTLVQLRQRAQAQVDWLACAEARLLEWYRDCDATAARTAARELQRLRDSGHSTDPLLLAWLGVALVRGPEVQIEHADGLFLRSAYRTSNAERTGLRLLAEVTERTGGLRLPRNWQSSHSRRESRKQCA